MPTFRSGEHTLAYDDIRPGPDQGPTVVLIHGFATNRAENWKRLGWYSAFERKGWRVVALDLRGHGESDKPHEPEAYATAALAGDVVALMDALELRRVDLMGYSLGAHLALAVAVANPDRISNLILAGVGARMLGGEAPSTPGAMTMSEALRTDDVDSITEPTLRGFRRFAENQGEDRLALAACGEGRGGRLPGKAELNRLVMPVLVVAGDRDEIAGDPRALAESIPGARSVGLPACDHFSAIPHGLFKAAVFDFLEGWLE